MLKEDLSQKKKLLCEILDWKNDCYPNKNWKPNTTYIDTFQIQRKYWNTVFSKQHCCSEESHFCQHAVWSYRKIHHNSKGFFCAIFFKESILFSPFQKIKQNSSNFFKMMNKKCTLLPQAWECQIPNSILSGKNVSAGHVVALALFFPSSLKSETLFQYFWKKKDILTGMISQNWPQELQPYFQKIAYKQRAFESYNWLGNPSRQSKDICKNDEKTSLLHKHLRKSTMEIHYFCMKC